MSKVEKTPLQSKRYSEGEVRARIKNYIECGGVMPISPTGEHNIARLFRIPVEYVQKLIREESAKIGREVYND